MTDTGRDASGWTVGLKRFTQREETGSIQEAQTLKEADNGAQGQKGMWGRRVGRCFASLA